MAQEQNWVGYLERSYSSIKKSVLSKLSTKTKEITDYSESNPFIILISIFAGIAEILHLYVDALAQECFLGTARKFSSILKISELLDYLPKTNIAATVDLKFTLVDNNNTPTPYLTGTIYIPKGTIVNTGSGVDFTVEEAGVIKPGATSVLLRAGQYTEVLNQTLGISNGTALQAFELPDNYRHNSLILSINNEEWKEYESFALMGPNTRGFIVTIMEDATAYCIFGNGKYGKIPTNNLTITASYKITEGTLGNVGPGTISNIPTALNTPANYKIICSNPEWAAGGQDFEALADIRFNAPLIISTQRRAVSYSDYHDLALLIPGVGKAKVYYPCADDIRLYIGPKTRGVASSGLLAEVENVFYYKGLVGRKVTALPAGINRLYLDLTIIGRPGYTELAIKQEAITALQENFSYDNFNINSTIKPSDIIGVLENDKIKSIDSITLTSLYLEPYARPYQHNIPLSIVWGKVKTNTSVEYSLVYKEGINPYFLLYRNGQYWATLTMGIPYADSNNVSFTINNNGLYQNNQQWNFRIYPSYPELGPVYNMAITDYSIPHIDIDTLNLDTQGLPKIFSNLTVVVNPSTNPNICK